jgi:hypothetical protein
MLGEPTNDLFRGLAKGFCPNASCPGSKFRVLHAVRHIRHAVQDASDIKSLELSR